MDADLLIIFPSVIIMLAIIGISVNGIVSKVFDAQKSRNSILSRGDNHSNRDLLERTAMIEDRLAVLERIATDRSGDLAHEIEQLRLDVKEHDRAEAAQ